MKKKMGHVACSNGSCNPTSRLLSLPGKAIFIAILLLASALPPVPAQAQAPADSVDVVLIVDTSGSMKRNDPKGARISAAKLFVDLSGEGDRIALVNLGGQEDTGQVLDLTEIAGSADTMMDQKRRIKEALDTLVEPKAENTFMGNALKVAYNILDRTHPGRRQYVVLLTDGEPAGESPTALKEAMDAFEERRFWKIFPVALGPEADYELLKTQVAEPSGGIAYKATTPEDLIRIYTEIFALLRNNRYVNWITVQPNSLESILTLTPDQRVTDLALVVPKQDKKPEIDAIISPADVNIVDPAYAAGIHRGADPSYEAYVINENSTPLTGEWKMRLLNQEPVEVATLTRSDHGIQLLTPSPIQSWDELSPRYHPLGEPLYVQVSVRNVTGKLEFATFDTSQPPSPIGEPELNLSPMAQMTQPQWDPIVLRDDGLGNDLDKDDGSYGGLYRAPDQPVEHLLDIEVPTRKDTPFRLVKSRSIQVVPLPSLKLTLPEFDDKQREIPVTLWLEQPSGQNVAVDGVEIALYLKNPAGKTTTLQTAPASEQNHYSASFTVSEMGNYTVWVVGRVSARLDDRSIPYTSIAQATYGIPLPNIAIEPPTVDLGTLSELGSVPLSLKFTSDALSPEMLNVSIEGLGGGVVEPRSLAIPPGKTSELKLTVGSTEVQKIGPGEFRLGFTSPQGTARVKGGEVVCKYKIVQDITVRPQEPPGTNLGEIDSIKEIQVTVIVKSDVAQEERLRARVEGPQWAEATVFPEEIKAPPKEENVFTFDISAELLPAGKRDKEAATQFHLILTSDGVPVEGGDITYTYEETPPPPFILCVGVLLLLLLIVGGGIFFLLRRRRAEV